MSAAKPSFPRLQRGHPLAQGTLASFPFYEGSGPIVNDLADQGSNGAAGEGFYGTFQGTTLPQWVGGQSGWAVNFNGVSGHTWIDCGAATPLSLGNTKGPISIASWVQPDNVSSTHGIISHGGSQWYFRLNAGKVDWLKSQVAGILTGNTACVVNTWNHVAVTEDAAGNVTLYLNGVIDATTTTATSFASNAVNLTIGSDNGAGTDVFTGNIDSIVVFNRVLARDDIAALFEDMYAPLRRRTTRRAAPGGYVPYDIPHSPQQQTVMAM